MAFFISNEYTASFSSVDASEKSMSFKAPSIFCVELVRPYFDISVPHSAAMPPSAILIVYAGAGAGADVFFLLLLASTRAVASVSPLVKTPPESSFME